MRKANDHQISHPVMKGSNRNWERGTWYTGVMAAGQATGDESYIDQAMRWGEEHKWQPGTERSGGNILTCTQTYLELYFLKTNRAFLDPVIQWVNSGPVEHAQRREGLVSRRGRPLRRLAVCGYAAAGDAGQGDRGHQIPRLDERLFLGRSCGDF